MGDSIFVCLLIDLKFLGCHPYMKQTFVLNSGHYTAQWIEQEKNQPHTFTVKVLTKPKWIGHNEFWRSV